MKTNYDNKINMSKTIFTQQFTVSIRDITYGQHLDHLALLEYLHETRVRYLNSIDCTELNVDGQGSSLTVSSLTCNYKKMFLWRYY